MNEVILGDTGVHTTQLGFGCGRLFRIPSSGQRQRVLETAFELGVRHYDVARMYGLGHAESEVGRFAAGKRDRVILATKFGIEPSSTAAQLARFQGVARAVIRWVPALRSRLRRTTQQLYRPKAFSASISQRSLETSLRELRTDYIDLFLLHEPTMQDAVHDDLIAWLIKARDDGRIRAFGVAGGYTDVCEMRRCWPQLTEVIQFPNDVLNRNLEKLEDRTQQSIITFSSMSSAMESLGMQLKSSTVQRRDWSNRLGADVGDPSVLATLLLKYSALSNPDGVTLFSTSSTERLTMLVTGVYRGDIISTAQADKFANLIAGTCPV